MKAAFWASVLALACSRASPPTLEPEVQDTGTVRLEVVASGLSSPLYLTAPAADTRSFIVEQRGTIRILTSAGVATTPFLDIRSKVSCCGERGLLSMAFHPSFATNGYFYVNYTDLTGDTRIERYQAPPTGAQADVNSAFLLLSVQQPASNHNGGHILFGPDGMLYIAMGDGGGAGDPQGNGQNPNSRLGKLLRMDPAGGTPTIWASGLRNPWRIAFDRESGLLYVADVGQNAWEEINVVPASRPGVNYGWNVMEGAHCYPASVTNCNTAGLTLPAVEYNHSQGCSVTGGFVYRGSRIPSLQGHYFYADYCRGWVRSFRYQNDTVTGQREWTEFGALGNVLSFGEDSSKELYILSNNGNVYKFVR